MKAFIDFLPLLGFLIAYKVKGMIYATIVLIVLTIVSLAALYVKEKKIAALPLFSGILVGIFGGLTWYFDNPDFIKLKPTIINILFAVAIVVGNKINKPFLKLLLNESVIMPMNAWKELSLRYAIFFALMAVVNEVVWRNFSEDIWVNFKVFGLMGLSIIFIMAQMPFIMKHQQNIQKG